MGRHSAPERAPFLRSVGAWALPWLLILAVLAVALVVVLDMVGNDPIRTGTGDDQPSGASAVETEGPEPTETSEVEPEAEKDDESQAAEGGGNEDGGNSKKKAPKLITEGIDVQILNGTSEGGIDDVMADKLARLGYTVVAVSPSGRAYDETVVFWTAGSEDVGAALADRFDWKLEPAPSNLSSEVHLHIMVGADRI